MPRHRALLAWALYDWASSGFSTVVETFVFAAYFTRRIAPDEATGAVVWGNTMAAAGLVIAVLGPVVGALADASGRRKPWIAIGTAVCVAATAALWFVRPDPAWMLPGVLLVALGVVASELATVPYNAMLSDLAATDHIGRWSGWAWGLGYAGGLVCLLLALVGLVQDDGAWLGLDAGSAQPVRATFVLVALWYLVFSLPLFVWTPDRRVRLGRVPLRPWAAFRALRGQGDLARFLVARMLYVDGLATVFAFGGVYAAAVFGMSEAEVLSFGIALNFTAGLGAVAFGWLDDRLGPRRTIIVSLAALIVAAVVVLAARTPAAFWAGGLAFGIVVGPVQASSRSLLARRAPPELRDRLFGLYALSGRATSFIGPLLVGWVTWLSGSQRLGMATVLVFFGAGLALVATVEPETRASDVHRAVDVR